MNEKAAGRTIKEVLDSFVPVEILNKIIPETGEINENIIKLAEKGDLIKLSNKGYTGPYKQADLAGEMLHMSKDDLITLGLSKKEAKMASQLAQNINPNNVEQTMENLRGISNSEDYQTMLNTIQEGLNDKKKTANADKLFSQMTTSNYLANLPKAYLNNEDPEINKFRRNTLVFGYAGMTVGRRYMQGGTLTADSEGRRNIAGVPFI